MLRVAVTYLSIQLHLFICEDFNYTYYVDHILSSILDMKQVQGVGISNKLLLKNVVITFSVLRAREKES